MNGRWLTFEHSLLKIGPQILLSMFRHNPDIIGLCLCHLIVSNPINNYSQFQHLPHTSHMHGLWAAKNSPSWACWFNSDYTFKAISMAAISLVPYRIAGFALPRPNTNSCSAKITQVRPCNNPNVNMRVGTAHDTFGGLTDARKRKRRSPVCAENGNGNGSDESPPSLKSFLDEAKSLGRVRIIVNTGVGILESITSLENLFYHKLEGRGEYANVMSKEDNVDFHLLVDKVKAGKLVKGKIARNGIPSYTIRLIDDKGSSAASFLLMWNPTTDGQYDPGQVEAFENLLRKYGSDISFA